MSRGLRIGVVLSGQLVDERVVRAGPVTVGTSLRCALSLPVDGLPREHVLFDDALELHAIPGAQVTTIPSQSGNRGKLVLGELTILFQTISLAAPMPRPRLPAELRRVSFDRKLAAIVGASLAAHAAIIAWAITRDAEILPSFAETYREGIDVQLPDYVDRVDPTIAPPTSTTPAPGPGVAHEAPRHQIVPTTPPPPSAIEAQRLANILTGDDGSNGFGGMSARQPGADLGTQIANARTTHATIGDGSHGSRVDDRAHIGDGSHLQTAEQALTEQQRSEEHVPVRVAIVPEPHRDPSQQDVVAKIQNAYVAGLQRCYRLALEGDASLEGKVALELTVGENGRVHEPSASGVDDAVDHCIAAQMSRWQFKAPRDEATYSISLILKPGQ